MRGALCKNATEVSYTRKVRAGPLGEVSIERPLAADPRLVRIHFPSSACSATVPLRPPGLRSPLRAVNANTKPLAGCGFPQFLRKNHPVGDTMSD
jgi:hypothetical protein